MRCEQIWDLLSAYADNETTNSDAAIVETHIAVCSECAANLRFMRTASGSLGLTPDVEPPISLRASILAATIYMPTWRQRFRAGWAATFNFRTIRYAALAGTTAMAILLAVHLNNAPIAVAPAGQHNIATAESGRPVASQSVPDPGSLFSAPLAANIEVPAAPAVPERTGSNRTSAHRMAATHMSRNPISTKSRQLAFVHTGRKSPLDSSRPGLASPADKPDADAVEPAEDMFPTSPMSPRTDVAKADSSDAHESMTPAAPPLHVALASYTEPAQRTQLLTLADLKRSLRRQANDDRSRFISESISEKRIRFDVVRGRF